jgi:hypothetical protein
MKVTILISRIMDGYLVGVLHMSGKPSRVWRQIYPSAEVCINQLVEYELASIFDADDFRRSSLHLDGGMIVHHTETDEETLKEAGLWNSQRRISLLNHLSCVGTNGGRTMAMTDVIAKIDAEIAEVEQARVPTDVPLYLC